MAYTILILTAGFGEGHNTAARNLHSALEYRGGPNVCVKTLDVFAMACGRWNEWTRRLYITAINKTPRLWQFFYGLLDTTRIFESFLFTLNPVKSELRRLLEQERPAAVFSTYPIYSFLLRELVREGCAMDFEQITVVTDSISINSLWYRAPSQWYIVPNDDTAVVLAGAGVARDKIHAFGFPVQLDFALPERRCTPDESSPPQVLYIINSGKSKAPEMVRQLLLQTKLHLTLAVGRDEALRDKLAAICTHARERVRIIGWTSDMPRLLMSHHLVITKAGGATTQESIAAECPPIFSQVVPGQEEGNWELVRRAHAGALAQTPAEAAAWVAKAMDQDAALWREWRANLKKINRPDSALRAADFALDRIRAHRNS